MKFFVVLLTVLSVTATVRSCDVQKALACEHSDDVTVTCPGDKVINVVWAGYGRNDHQTCGSDHALNTNCLADGSFDIIRGNCQDRNSCTLAANNNVFGDPCWGTLKYIEMKYICEDSVRYTPHEAIACEHRGSVTVTCPDNEVIIVTQGFYGRDDHETCPGNVFTTDCHADGSLEILRNTCNNKQSCVISASNSVFGDPCVNTNKLIKMEYYCVKKPVKDIHLQKALACEHHDDVTVTCPRGDVIVAAHGFYGRDEAESCPGNVFTTDCLAENSDDIIKCNCMNQNTCLLQASNNVFGDPCVNTNKLLKLDYFCVPSAHNELHLDVACEHHSSVKAQCPSANQIIEVVDGFYGRDDHHTCPGNVFTTDCVGAGTLDVLKNNCNGHNSCVLDASNSIFGDPCPRTNKLIKLYYYCI